MTINVGPACIDRTNVAATRTRVNLDNPANASGTIDTVCVYANIGNDLSGLEYAAFADEGSNTLSTNGDTDGSNLSATGGQQTIHTAAGNDFTAFAISVGEYIGVYLPGGYIELSLTGGGYWSLVGDNIPCSSTLFAFSVNKAMSLYATGVEVGVGVAPTSIFSGPFVGPFGGPI